MEQELRRVELWRATEVADRRDLRDGPRRAAARAVVQDDQVSRADLDQLPTLEFIAPLAGFPDHRLFVLVELEPSGLLCALRCVDDDGLRFLVAPPGAFFPDYQPAIGDDWARLLELQSPQDALVLSVITPGEPGSPATANLFAPVVINVRSRKAAQIILDDSDLPLRAPLPLAAR